MAEDNRSTSSGKGDDSDLRSLVMALATQMAEMQATMKADRAKPPPSPIPPTQTTTNPINPANPNPSTSGPVIILPEKPDERWFHDPPLVNVLTDEQEKAEMERRAEIFRGKAPVGMHNTGRSDHFSGGPKFSGDGFDYGLDYTGPEKVKSERDEEMDQMRSMMQAMKDEIVDLKKGKADPVIEEDWSLGLENAPKSLVPPNFVMPELEKYVGTSDPAIFMRTYVNMMRPFALGEPVVLQLFSRYISHAAFDWYN